MFSDWLPKSLLTWNFDYPSQRKPHPLYFSVTGTQFHQPSDPLIVVPLHLSEHHHPFVSMGFWCQSLNIYHDAENRTQGN